MTTRSLDHFQTLRHILEVNDKFVAESQKQEAFSDPSQNGNRAPAFSLKSGSLSSICNYERIWQNKRARTALTAYLVFMISQFVINYFGLLVLIIVDRPIVLTISQIWNILGSYFFSIFVGLEINDNIAHPFQDLNREVGAFRELRISLFAQSISLILNFISTVIVWKSPDPWLSLQNDPTLDPEDFTMLMRVFTMLSLQISILAWLVTVINLYITDRRLLSHFYKIEHTQQAEDIETKYNDICLNDTTYELDFKTYYNKNGSLWHGSKAKGTLNQNAFRWYW